MLLSPTTSPKLYHFVKWSDPVGEVGVGGPLTLAMAQPVHSHLAQDCLNGPRAECGWTSMRRAAGSVSTAAWCTLCCYSPCLVIMACYGMAVTGSVNFPARVATSARRHTFPQAAARRM